jgi:nicotinamidase-related amidase
LRARSSHLLVIDVQERLLPAVPRVEEMIAAIRRLVSVARALDVGITLTEHNPTGLGGTPSAIRDLVDPTEIFEKMSFSCLAEPHIRAHCEQLREAGVSQVVLCGLEAHICILQTAIELREMDLETFIAVDAASARSVASVELGLRRAALEGVSLVNSDMIVFEWLERAGTELFRSILPLMKA